MGTSLFALVSEGRVTTLAGTNQPKFIVVDVEDHEPPHPVPSSSTARNVLGAVPIRSLRDLVPRAWNKAGVPARKEIHGRWHLDLSYSAHR